MINNGVGLRVDIVYITYVQELREVTELGPKDWFTAKKREEWKFKESILIKGGQKAVLRLDPLILKRTVLLVVYANYNNAMEPADMQTIIDYAGRENEIIFLRRASIQPKNKSLRYVK